MSETKLATIVAIDVAGYSAHAQADEAAAIQSVARLNLRCAEAAQARGGRIFSTAGDAVMMEFPSVSGALEAAEALARNPDPPIRAGIHLGEVTVMPNGDLLGHGVNVAARLQNLAQAGGVLVSADARRALRGPMAARLTDKGVVKLNKIDESIGVYELTQEAHASASPARATGKASRFTLIAALAAAAVAVIVALVVFWPLLDQPTTPARVAVFALEAPADDSTAQRLADGVAEDVALALSAINVQTIVGDEVERGGRDGRLERARRLGAVLILDGAVENDAAGHVRLTLAVARSSDNVTIWSRAFPIEEGASLRGLRLRASEQSADVLSCGVNALRMHGSPLDTETLSLFLRSCEEWRDAPLKARDTLAQVIELEPRFSFARARLALSGAVASGAAPDSIREDTIARARANATRALRENANLGEAYIALQLLEAPRNWAERDRLMRQAIERDDRNATVNNFYAVLLHELGRTSEALAFAERSVTLDPLSQSKRRSVALLLLDNGRADEARAILEPMAEYLPDNQTLWRARVGVALWSRRFDDAAALLERPIGETGASATLPCWRHALQVLRSDNRSPQAISGLRDCSDRLPPDQTLLLHVALGDLDGAFAFAETLLRTDSYIVTALFAPAAEPLRADRRFMPLMRDWGLLQYWAASGRWPDFCADPELPYRCEAEAARLI